MYAAPRSDPRFDTAPERRNTGSLKWDRYGDRDIVPLWVADMDFRSPEAVLQAVHRAVDHGVFGYARPTRADAEAFCEHEFRLTGWRIDPSWLTWTSGVNVAMQIACRALAPGGGEALVPSPVYPPFYSVAVYAGLDVVRVPLAEHPDRGWEYDFDALEAAVTPRTRILLLCHPHNPVGRAWYGVELERIAEFCLRHRISVVSDEVHAGLTLVDRPHLPFASLGADAARICVTLQGPTKTYNQPGFGIALAIASDAGTRRALERVRPACVSETSHVGFAAARAAWEHGESWRLALLSYLRANRTFLGEELRRVLPAARVCPTEATYLAWVDVRAAGLGNPTAWFEAKGVGVSDGTAFGAPGWVRLNFACPRATLAEALRRLGT